MERDACAWEEELKVFNVSAQALESLAIVESFYQYSEFQLLVIDAPNLLYLIYWDVVPDNVSVMNLQCLVQADIAMPCHPPFDGGIASNLMKAISSVKYLRISVLFSEKELEDIGLPMFPNLTNLELGVGDKIGWEMLAHILEHSHRKSCNLWDGL